MNPSRLASCLAALTCLGAIPSILSRCALEMCAVVRAHPSVSRATQKHSNLALRLMPERIISSNHGCGIFVNALLPTCYHQRQNVPRETHRVTCKATRPAAFSRDELTVVWGCQNTSDRPLDVALQVTFPTLSGGTALVKGAVRGGRSQALLGHGDAPGVQFDDDRVEALLQRLQLRAQRPWVGPVP